jgi:hypothetical protein
MTVVWAEGQGPLFQLPCGGLLVASLLLHFPAASSLGQCRQLRTINREGAVGRQDHSGGAVIILKA